MAINAEKQRLAEIQERKGHWRRWGPYLSELAPAPTVGVKMVSVGFLTITSGFASLWLCGMARISS